MKFKALSILFLVIALLALPVVAHAQAEDPVDTEPALTEIERVVYSVGLGGAVSVLVQLLKRFGAIPDGAGGTAATAINVVVFAVLIGINTVFGVDLSGEGAQGVFDVIARLADLLAAVLASLGTFHGLRAGQVTGFRKT